MLLYCSSCEKDMPSDFVFCPICSMRAPNSNPTQINNEIGQNQRPPVQPNYNPNTPPPVGTGYKVESTGILLALFPGLIGLSGIGHMYAGKVGKGVALLIGCIVLDIIGWGLVLSGFSLIVFGGGVLIWIGAVLLITYFGIWIWHIFDARNACREYNEYFAKYGQPPW